MGYHRASIAGAFLEGTRFCDSTSARIARTAAYVTAGAADDREKAVRLFRWVQDEIQYAILHDWSRTASQTLLQRRGSCSNKANLLCAMLRAQRIPAGFGVLVVHGRKYFGPAWFPALQQRCDERSRHFFATVHLGGRWLRCDPSDDRALSAATSHINPPSARVHFSGTDHADLRLDPAHVLSSTWPVADIDRFLARRTTKPKEDFELLDSAVRFARQHGAACKDLAELEERFWAWRGPTGSRPGPTGRRPAPGSPSGPG